MTGAIPSVGGALEASPMAKTMIKRIAAERDRNCQNYLLKVGQKPRLVNQLDSPVA